MMRKAVQPKAVFSSSPLKTSRTSPIQIIIPSILLGNHGDVVDLGIGASAWNDNGTALDANGFHTFTQTFDGINLILKVEHDWSGQFSLTEEF